MIIKEITKIIDKYYNASALFDFTSVIEFNTILYLMFIDEYYETKLRNSMINADDINGLSDCVLKKLNIKIKQLSAKSSILKSTKLNELPGLSHWIIPDVEHNEAYIEDNKLYVSGSYQDNKLLILGELNNNILSL